MDPNNQNPQEPLDGQNIPQAPSDIPGTDQSIPPTPPAPDAGQDEQLPPPPPVVEDPQPTPPAGEGPGGQPVA